MTTSLNIIMGLFYIFLSALSILINLVLLAIIWKPKEYKTGTYRIIKNICVSCIMQLVPFFVGGFMTLADDIFNYWLDRILGAVLESTWFTYISLVLTLAVDRMLVFMPNVPDRAAMIINWTLLTLSWIFGLCAFIILLIPCFGYTNTSPTGRFAWVKIDCSYALMFVEVEKYLDFGFFIVDLVIYSIVCVCIYKLSKMTAQSSSSKAEIRIFLVALISFVYESFFIIWSFWIPGFLPSQRTMEMVANTMWIVDSGLFASATLLISVSLRRKVKTVVVTGLLRQKTTVVPTISTTMVSSHM